MNVWIRDLDGNADAHNDVDRVTFINAASYGEPVELEEDEQSVVVVNVSGFSSLRLTAA